MESSKWMKIGIGLLVGLLLFSCFIIALLGFAMSQSGADTTASIFKPNATDCKQEIADWADFMVSANEYLENGLDYAKNSEYELAKYQFKKGHDKLSTNRAPSCEPMTEDIQNDYEDMLLIVMDAMDNASYGNFELAGSQIDQANKTLQDITRRTGVILDKYSK